MSTIVEIKKAVSRLSLEDLARFRQWFDEFDAKSGKLDHAADQAIADFRAGPTNGSNAVFTFRLK